MNNCFINSIISALLNYNSFKTLSNYIINDNDNDNNKIKEILKSIINNKSQELNNLVFTSRKTSSQEDCEDFINILFPKFNYIFQQEEIILNNNEKDIIKYIIYCDKSKLLSYVNNNFNNNMKKYKLLYDFIDIYKLNENINNSYIKNYKLYDLFYILYYDNECIYKSFIINIYNNESFDKQLNNITIIQSNKYIIFRIHDVYNNNNKNHNDIFIPNMFQTSIKETYILKSITYYIYYEINNYQKKGCYQGHYINNKVNIDNKYILNEINNNKKPYLLFYERE